ncbi:MAG: LysR family transcriptional regulator [Myxococcaceae bacterium]
MDRFRQLEVLVAVVDAGSFVKASQRLRQSTAGVSRAVNELEERVGARLLQRTTRRLSLTEVGRAYVERSREILSALSEADGLATGSKQVAGRLRVSAPQSYGVLKLAPLWPKFLARHPALTLEVVLKDRLVDLVDEGFDVAVRITRQQDSSLVSRRLTTERLRLCASPRYLARRAAPRKPADLASHPVIAYTLLASRDTWHFETPRGPESVKVTARFETNSGDTCRTAALAGAGVILQPDMLVADDLERGELVELLPDCRAAEFGVFATYPTRKFLSGKVKALVDFLAHELG